MVRGLIAFFLLCAATLPAQAQGDAPPAPAITANTATVHFPGEPDRDFRRNAGAVAQYWCSEAWATRGFALDYDLFKGDRGLDMDEVTLDAAVAPSLHGLSRIADFWGQLNIYFEAQVGLEYEILGGMINAWFPLKQQLEKVLKDIAAIEARLRNQAPITARRAKIKSIEELLASAAPLPAAIADLERRLAEANGWFNLGNRDRLGTSIEELNEAIAGQQKSFIDIRERAKAAGVLDGLAATPTDLSARLQAEKSFHEAELARELKELGIPEEDTKRLQALQAERDALREKIRLALQDSGNLSDRLQAAELQLRAFKLVSTIVEKCIKDQAEWLRNRTSTVATDNEPPADATVPATGGTITGFFKLSCDVTFSTASSLDGRLEYLTGPMVAEIRDDGTIALSLRARDPAGNPAHDTIISTTLTFDPVTGHAQTKVGIDAADPAAPMFEIVSAFLENRDGQTRISGAYCSGPKPGAEQSLLEMTGATSVCTGKFWGPEEIVEPSGPETSCGS